MTALIVDHVERALRLVLLRRNEPPVPFHSVTARHQRDPRAVEQLPALAVRNDAAVRGNEAHLTPEGRVPGRHLDVEGPPADLADLEREALLDELGRAMIVARLEVHADVPARIGGSLMPLEGREADRQLAGELATLESRNAGLGLEHDRRHFVDV